MKERKLIVVILIISNAGRVHSVVNCIIFGSQKDFRLLIAIAIGYIMYD